MYDIWKHAHVVYKIVFPRQNVASYMQCLLNIIYSKLPNSPWEPLNIFTL